MGGGAIIRCYVTVFRVWGLYIGIRRIDIGGKVLTNQVCVLPVTPAFCLSLSLSLSPSLSHTHTHMRAHTLGQYAERAVHNYQCVTVLLILVAVSRL